MSLLSCWNEGDLYDSHTQNLTFLKTKKNDGCSKVTFSMAILLGTFSSKVNKVLTRQFDKHTSPPPSEQSEVCPTVSDKYPEFPGLLLLTSTEAHAHRAVPETDLKGLPWL